MSRLSDEASMARGIRLSSLQCPVGLDQQSEFAGVCEMSVPGLGHSRHDFSGYAEIIDPMVSGNLVGGHSEERRQRLGRAADSGTGQLHNGMGLAA